MEPIGLWPEHGPDPERPEDQFESGGHSYLLMVTPVILPHWLLLYLFNNGQPILGAIYEELGGWIAQCLDRRFKLIVFRGVRAGGHGWRFVYGEVYPGHAEAQNARTQMLRHWSEAPFAEARPLSRRAARAELRLKKDQAGLQDF